MEEGLPNNCCQIQTTRKAGREDTTYPDVLSPTLCLPWVEPNAKLEGKRATEVRPTGHRAGPRIVAGFGAENDKG